MVGGNLPPSPVCTPTNIRIRIPNHGANRSCTKAAVVWSTGCVSVKAGRGEIGRTAPVLSLLHAILKFVTRQGTNGGREVFLSGSSSSDHCRVWRGNGLLGLGFRAVSTRADTARKSGRRFSRRSAAGENIPAP